MTLADYGHTVMKLALRGLEDKTLDPYLAGWRRRVILPWGTYQCALSLPERSIARYTTGSRSEPDAPP